MREIRHVQVGFPSKFISDLISVYELEYTMSTMSRHLPRIIFEAGLDTDMGNIIASNQIFPKHYPLDYEGEEAVEYNGHKLHIVIGKHAAPPFVAMLNNDPMIQSWRTDDSPLHVNGHASKKMRTELKYVFPPNLSGGRCTPIMGIKPNLKRYIVTYYNDKKEKL